MSPVDRASPVFEISALDLGSKQAKTISCIKKYRVETPEGWALKQAKKLYRFNDQQRKYLEAKFTIGQESGMKLDAEAVAKEMRRARGSNGERLFKVSEFLTAHQVASFFS